MGGSEGAIDRTGATEGGTGVDIMETGTTTTRTTIVVETEGRGQGRLRGGQHQADQGGSIIPQSMIVK